MVEAVKPEQVKEIIEELRRLCLDRNAPNVQLHAIALFLDRVMGKPSQQILVDRTETHTVKMDFSKLPTEKLLQLQDILQDSGTVIDVQPEADAKTE